MQTKINPLSRLHRFLAGQLFYPLLLSSLLTIMIWLGRVYLTQSLTYNFFIWNLFLAWVPYLFGLVVVAVESRFPGKWWLWTIPFVFWLIFFPNAPYVVTDLWHLDERPGVPFWYEVGLFATFAWTGLLLAVVSLNTIQRVASKYVGTAGSWFLVASVIFLSGFGIYLGRFLEWNSWDLFLRPHGLFSDILERILHPVRYIRTYGVTAMFGSFLLVCYVTFTAIQHREKGEA